MIGWGEKGGEGCEGRECGWGGVGSVVVVLEDAGGSDWRSGVLYRQGHDRPSCEA